MIGGLYIIDDKTMDLGGKKQTPSTYKHDVEINVKVVNKKHPITRGISDFSILDEAYGGLYYKPGINVLLETDNSLCSKYLAWTQTYGKGRVVTIQLGHDHQAWENPNYIKLLKRSIRWAYGKKLMQPKTIKQSK